MNFWKNFNKIKRAHQYYLAFMLSIPSFLSIIYTTYVVPSPLGYLFPSINRFFIVFVILYLPVTWLLGNYFFEPKPNRPKSEEARLDMKANPWNMDITKALLLMAQGDNEEAVEVLKKWQ